MKKNKYNSGAALSFALLITFIISSLCLTLSLMIYSYSRVNLNEALKKENMLIATNYAFNAYYDYDYENLDTTDYAFNAYYENLDTTDFDVKKTTIDSKATVVVIYQSKYKVTLVFDESTKKLLTMKEGE